MKITYRQIEAFVFDLPTNMDYDSPVYSKIVMDELELQERIETWLKSLGIEVGE